MLYRKRIAQALAAAGLVIAMSATTAFASIGTAHVNTGALRLRAEPNTNCTTLTTLTKGTEVTLLSGEENGWYKVSYKNYTGYMSAEYLKASILSGNTEPAEEPVAAPSEEADSDSGFSAYVNAGPLNVRSGPGTGYKRIGSLTKGTDLTVLDSEGDWYQISCGTLTGYVSSRYVTKREGSSPAANANGSVSASKTNPSFTEKEVDQSAMVLHGPLNVRSGPGTGYNRIGSLRTGSNLTVLASTDNGWYKIRTASGLTGYVHGDYVIFMSDLQSSPVGAAAAALATSLLGKPYVYGAEGPNSFDCSGLSYYIYRQLGHSLARGSSGQYRQNGTFVPISEIEPGDLVFIFDPRFDGSGGTLPTTHMGIYVGDGLFVHASSYDRKVVTSKLHGSYYTPYIVGIKRIG